jgi:predicted lipid-binding transport protein (Tim44 family)
MRWAQSVTRLAALVFVLLIGAEEGDARPVDEMSLGPRESNTLISSRVTAVAARTVALGHPMRAQVVPSYPGGSLNGLFSRGGMLGGFAAGFLGSGVLGLLFGRGLYAGLGGVPSYLGLIFQLALLLMLGRLIWRRWHSDDALSPAGLSPRQLADPYLRSRDDLYAPIDPSAGDDFAEKDESSRLHSSKVGASRRQRVTRISTREFQRR